MSTSISITWKVDVKKLAGQVWRHDNGSKPQHSLKIHIFEFTTLDCDSKFVDWNIFRRRNWRTSWSLSYDLGKTVRPVTSSKIYKILYSESILPKLTAVSSFCHLLGCLEASNVDKCCRGFSNSHQRRIFKSAQWAEIFLVKRFRQFEWICICLCV